MKLFTQLVLFFVCGCLWASPGIGTVEFEYTLHGSEATADKVVKALKTSADDLDISELHVFSYQEKERSYVTFATSLDQYEKLREIVDLEWVRISMRRQGVDSVEFETPQNLDQEIFELEEGALKITPDFMILIVKPLREDFEEDLEAFLLAYLGIDTFSFTIATNSCCFCLELKGVEDQSDFLAKFDFGKLLKQTSEVYVYVQD